MSGYVTERTVLTNVQTADITNDTVTLAKLAGGTDGNLITYDTSGDPAAVTVGTATHVLTSAGAGAVPTFKVTTSPIDLRLMFLLIAENAGDRLNMVDGIVDPFKDEGDVDTSTAATSNQTYDASGDFYHNEYKTLGVLFDGTNDYMSRGADLTGQADGKLGIISFWFDFNGSDDTLVNFFDNEDNEAYLRKTTDNKFHIQMYATDASTVLLAMTSDTAYTASGGWTHFLATWDVGNARAQLYINGVDDRASSPTIVDQNINYTQSQWYFGAISDGSRKINANVADFYLNYAATMDFSVAANREKFIKYGKPVSLGSDGSLPTGTAPIVYFRAGDGGAAVDFDNNLGGGGDMSITGTLALSADNPSDSPVNMTLASNDFTADSAPATGRIHIQAKPIDAITLNTDLTAEISRDGGTTFTTATLVAKETLADGTIAYEDADVDISGQPTNTAMKWRIKTLNNKNIEVHGVVLQWA